MAFKETKYRVHCPISNRPEDVFIRSVQWNDIFLASFNGCDHNWHLCQDCENCRRSAQARFTEENAGSQSIHWSKT